MEKAREREQGVGVRVVKQQATRCGAHLLTRRLSAELPGAEPATQARRHDEVSAAPEHRDRRGAELERRCCRRCCHRVRASTRSRELARARSVGDGERCGTVLLTARLWLLFAANSAPAAKQQPLLTNNKRTRTRTMKLHEHTRSHWQTHVLMCSAARGACGMRR